MRQGIALTVEVADRARLEAIVADCNRPHKHVWRARIILLTAAGVGTTGIECQTGKDKTCVWRWQERFMLEGVDGLLRDKTRPSGKSPLATTMIERVVALTGHDPPVRQRTGPRRRWQGRSASASARCNEFGEPMACSPIACTCSSSRTIPPLPPSCATSSASTSTRRPTPSCCRSTRSRKFQALDRTQPGLPIKKGRCQTMTHDYKRHGTTTLFAALNVLEGKVIGRCMQRHRHQEFIRFLNAIEAEVPAGKLVHVILDNYATHKHSEVRAWLKRHPRFFFHFTPTSSSWLNAVEGYFAKLTRSRLKRGVFRSIVDLQATINRFLAETNHQPKPFVWTADPDKIIAAVDRGRQVLDSIH